MIRSHSFRWIRLALALVCLFAVAAPADAKPRRERHRKPRLDRVLKDRSKRHSGTSRVIVTLKPGWDASSDVARMGGRLGRRLRSISGMAVELPNRVIERLANHPAVESIHYDRPISGQMNRVALTVGARTVQYYMGYDGAGVGVAVIDSGITSWHDDLTYYGSSPLVRTRNGQRVVASVDFVNDSPVQYDDNGHGTHVAGIIAGNGYDSHGSRAGIAPGAHLISLKVLDQDGRGYISDVIAAFDWAIANRATHNIRVINLSVGAAVTESYNTDPLTLAARRAVDAGIVVVTAAGNLGKNGNGEPQYGAITAPGNAPWVLTVGAYSTQGTYHRFDDRIAPYSSRGPTAIDYAAKPDLVAPGTGIVSLADPTSRFYASKANYLLRGSRWLGHKPYLSLSGTSMAAPVVAGTVALMLQANPALTPNLVKAILQYTAQRGGYDALTQGAGFLNAHGAVELARYFAHARPGDRYPSSRLWSREIHWGNYRLTGGVIKPNGSAWAQNIVWGTLAEAQGDNIVWGTLCGSRDCDNIVWGTLDEADNIVWGTLSGDDNIVWGTLSGDDDNIVWGTLSEADNIVWGTLSEADNIVWGTLNQADNIVWGTASLDNIVWGTACAGRDCDNIVWGTAMELDNIVWGTAIDVDNIVWGTGALDDNIVWGTAQEDVTWGNSGEDAVLFNESTEVPLTYDPNAFEQLFQSPSVPPDGGTSPTGILGGGF